MVLRGCQTMEFCNANSVSLQTVAVLGRSHILPPRLGMGLNQTHQFTWFSSLNLQLFALQL